MGRKYKVDVSRTDDIILEDIINKRIKQLEESVDNFELISVSIVSEGISDRIIIAYKYYDHGEEE